jgi:cytochrome c
MVLIPILVLLSSCKQEDPRVLVFTKTAGFYHTSIPAGVEAIKNLGTENGFEVDTTSSAGFFNEENLRNYAAVIFLNTTGEVLNHYQEADFERFIQAGGGYVGIHSAADTEYHWGWYGRLVGGYFLDHPGINDPHPNVQEGLVEVVDHSHPSTDFLPEQWVRTDEWYSYQNLNENVNVLLTLDESSYEGGAEMGYHPLRGIMNMMAAVHFIQEADTQANLTRKSCFSGICLRVLNMRLVITGLIIPVRKLTGFLKKTGSQKPCW